MAAAPLAAALSRVSEVCMAEPWRGFCALRRGPGAVCGGEGADGSGAARLWVWLAPSREAMCCDTSGAGVPVPGFEGLGSVLARAGVGVIR